MSEDVVNHFVKIPREKFQALLRLKAASGARTWDEFYSKLEQVERDGRVFWTEEDLRKNDEGAVQVYKEEMMKE